MMSLKRNILKGRNEELKLNNTHCKSDYADDKRVRKRTRERERERERERVVDV